VGVEAEAGAEAESLLGESSVEVFAPLSEPRDPLRGSADAERELLVLVREGAMTPLLMTVSSGDSTGSLVGAGGAMISGG
jgi:hypothetical protein